MLIEEFDHHMSMAPDFTPPEWNDLNTIIEHGYITTGIQFTSSRVYATTCNGQNPTGT